MIKYIKRKDLNLNKYDFCIEHSVQSRIYGFSWYLDIVADNWDVLVLDDYKAVMPIPWRKKFGIKYMYPPFWVLELGIFSLDHNLDTNTFLEHLFKEFKFVDSRLNSDNYITLNQQYLQQKTIQILNFDKDYNTLFDNYRKDRKKDLKKALKLDLTEKWNDNPENLISLFKENVGTRTPNIVESDYTILNKLINVCLQNNVGEILSIYDHKNLLVASGFFLKHNNVVTILISSTDFKNRNNGANTFLIDRAIFKFEKNYKVFNFGGSSMQTIAKYFLSFNAETKKYQHIKYNKLPILLKLFKR
ncbi:hypothetical protein [Polaribacter aestuariivivens]|uniref:hypothetical protein n=1 Tax=Polaribacter aestuariivivens TaxID=2304626 RepID=UPI003F49726A